MSRRIWRLTASFRISLANTSQRCTRCFHSFKATSKPPESCGAAFGRIIDSSIWCNRLALTPSHRATCNLHASNPLPRSTFNSSKGGPCTASSVHRTSSLHSREPRLRGSSEGSLVQSLSPQHPDDQPCLGWPCQSRLLPGTTNPTTQPRCPWISVVCRADARRPPSCLVVLTLRGPTHSQRLVTLTSSIQFVAQIARKRSDSSRHLTPSWLGVPCNETQILILISYVLFLISYFLFLISYFLFLISYFLFLMSYF